MEKKGSIPEWSPTEYESVYKIIQGLNGNAGIFLSSILCDCESPIEELFAIGLCHELGLLSSKALDNYKNGTYRIYPQKIFKVDGSNYRADFCIIKFEIYKGHKIGSRIIVECDGYEFHSDKEQINRDNKRDLDILANYGSPTIRFLGSEINENPFKCAKSVIAAVSELLENKMSLIRKYGQNE